jgi:hypothetical protein
MVKLETLTARSLRYYELGRLRMAARIALVLLPIAAVCLLEPIGRETCACCAGLLLAACVWLRFRSRAGVESVSTGLLAGGIPLAAALVLTRLDPGCAAAGPISYCTGFSLLIGAAAGTVVALRERGRSPLSDRWLLARLGVASVVGVALGMLIGRASVSRMAAAQP